MSATLTLPSGTKVRSQSSRRFVVVTEYTSGKAVIRYRTDDVHRAVAFAARKGDADYTIVDTLGRKVRVFAPDSYGGGTSWKWVAA